MAVLSAEMIDLARRELSRSFEPREWYARDDDAGDEELGTTEDCCMWVFRLIAGVFVTGFFTPDREWVEDASHPTKEQAAARVHYLNGGR